MKPIYEGKYLEFGFYKEEWFILPLFAYIPKKYRYEHTRPIHIAFLGFYILIGKERGKLTSNIIW